MIVTQPQDVVANIAGSARFSCAVSSGAGVTWQWEHNGVAMPGQTKSYLDLTNVAAGHVGAYAVRIKAGGTSLQSATATLTVLNNLGDLATHFKYPIGDRQWKAEFSAPSTIDERNNLYPENAPGTGNPSRCGAEPPSGWYVSQDVGSYYGLSGYDGIHAGEDWNYVNPADTDGNHSNDCRRPAPAS